MKEKFTTFTTVSKKLIKEGNFKIKSISKKHKVDANVKNKTT